MKIEKIKIGMVHADAAGLYVIMSFAEINTCFVYYLQVWSSLILYRKILDAIEDNDYDNLTKRAYVGRTKKLLMLPLSYTRSLSSPNTKFCPSLQRLS